MTTRILLFLASSLVFAGPADAQEPPLTQTGAEQLERQEARRTTEQRAERRLDAEWQDLLRRIPDSLRPDGRVPGTVIVDGRLLEPIPPHSSETAMWNMPQQPEMTPVRRDFVHRLTSGWLVLSNGQASNWEYGRRIWGAGSIYPGSYLDARTISMPLPR